MLSVQSAGCAGMERLGVPARTSLNSPPDDRGHISRRMRVDTIQARDLLVRDTTLLSDRQIRNNNHLHQYHRVGCGGSSSSSYSSNIRSGIDAATIMTAKQQQQAVAAKLKPIDDKSQHQPQQTQIRCPHHIPLPDSEWGQDRDLQIRAQYQQSEITRSYIKPPPNKTVLDVPEQSYNFYSSTTLSSMATSAANSGVSCNSKANLTNQHSNYHLQQHHQISCSSGAQQSAILTQQQHQKSKPSVITKLFSRKSSPKSPTALCSSSSISSNSSLSSSASLSSSSSSASSSSSSASLSSSASSSSSSPSTSSSVSTSSSSSSLCSAQALPISIAATLTATTCSLGSAAPFHSNLMPSGSSNLTTIGATAHQRVSPSPPLAVSVPVATGGGVPLCSSNMLQQQKFHLQQHQLLVDSTNSSNLSSTSLHLLKNSSSCNLSPTSSTVAGISDVAATSIDCCYAQATSTNIQRSHSSSSSSSTSSSSSQLHQQQKQQQQQSIDNCVNSNNSSSSSISSNNSMSSSRNFQHHI